MKISREPLFVAVLVLLSRSVSGAAEAPGRSEWENTVAAAEREGQLVVYTGGEVSQIRIEEAFQSAYPKIKVATLTGRGSQLGPRIIAERRAGKYGSINHMAGTRERGGRR